MADEPAASVTDDEQPPATTDGEQDAETEAGDQSSDVKALKDAMAKVRKEAREAEKARKAAEAKVKEFEDRDKSDLEKLTETNEGLQTELADARTKLARFEVAADKKLPAELAELLSGTKEEMAVTADVLLQHLKENATAPDFGGGPRTPAKEAKKPDQEHNDLILHLTGHLPSPDTQ